MVEKAKRQKRVTRSRYDVRQLRRCRSIISTVRDRLYRENIPINDFIILLNHYLPRTMRYVPSTVRTSDRYMVIKWLSVDNPNAWTIPHAEVMLAMQEWLVDEHHKEIKECRKDFLNVDTKETD